MKERNGPAYSCRRMCWRTKGKTCRRKDVPASRRLTDASTFLWHSAGVENISKYDDNCFGTTSYKVAAKYVTFS